VARPAGIRIVVLVAVLLVPACHRRTPQQERVSLCGDLGSLRATVTFLRAPDAAARVGEVRGDLDKIDPTVNRVHRSGVVDDALGQQLVDAQRMYHDRLNGVGDDDRFATVADAADGEALWGAYEAVSEQLGCGASLGAGG